MLSSRLGRCHDHWRGRRRPRDFNAAFSTCHGPTLDRVGFWRRAWAHGAPVVGLSVESATVGLGELFDVQLSAQAAEMPRFPELELPRGLVASRPSVGTSTNLSIVNGVRIDRLGLEAHWRVRASETGTFTIGPATVRVGDRVIVRLASAVSE